MIKYDIIDVFFASDESDDDSIILQECNVSSSSSDDKAENNLQLCLFEKLCFKKKRNSIMRYFEDIIPKYTLEEFKRHFRLNIGMFKFISKRFEDDEFFKKLEKNHRVKCAEFHISVFLWYAGHQATGFHDVGDRFNISISTVHAVVKRVSYFISSISGEYITWPDEQEKEKTSNYFHGKNGFPDVIDKYLLGDSAYPCTKFLITPFRDSGHLTAAQKNFNIKLSSCRVKIEHSFGKLKQRFRQLYFCKLQGIEYLCHFIRACCVLHNMSDIEDIFIDPLNNNDEDTYEDGGNTMWVMDSAAGKALRNDICNRLYKQ